MKRNGSSIALSLGLASAAGTLALLLGTQAAFAQARMFNNPGGPVVGRARVAPPALPPPPGVPGAAPSTAVTAPSQPAPSGLDPTTELFGAINKGNLAAARDAIGRGAELNAKNVLGMTPLEDAVDLNRNDIAFLLLSIKHEHNAAAGSAAAGPMISAPPAPAAVPGRAAPPAEGSVAALLLANGAPATGQANRHAARTPPASPPSPPRAADPDPPPASLADQAGGNPDPAIGFLGFGPHA